MPTLDELLDHPPKTAPRHPRLQAWEDILANPRAKIELEVFRPRTAFGLVQSEMNLHIATDGQRQPLETLLWDDELNVGLIQMGVQAVDDANEAERFALGLRAAFRKAERDFGDGFFNSVLYQFVSESGLASDPAILDILKHAYALGPNLESKKYGPCRELIEVAIAGRMHELTEELDYEPVRARDILVAALARYLDERFSVSNRRALGLL